MQIHCKYDELLSIKDVQPDPNNRNKHDKDQIEQLAKIIEYQGWRWPLVINKDTKILRAGHGRLLAAKKLKLKEVPVVYQEFKDSDQDYAFMVSDNAIGHQSELDLSSINLDIGNLGPDFDIDLLGIKNLKIHVADKELGDEEETPEPPKKSKVVRGEIYILGDHRLMCGDSTMIDDVERLMNGHQADLLHTDPPYNVDYSNQDRPKAGKKDFGKIKNDAMDDSQFKEFLQKTLSNAYLFLKENSSAYIWYASKESISFIEATKLSGFEINQQIIWKKPMLLGRGRYQWAHEPCIFAVKGKPYFTDDRTKTTVWDFGGYDKTKNIHPTQKPIFLPEEAINNSSKIGSYVLDLFGGSGSTLIACEKTARTAFIMELDSNFVHAILNRWEKYTGRKAIREDGKLWEEIKNG